MSYLTKLIFLTGALIVGLVAGTAFGDTKTADTFFQWVTKTGAIAFTDDFSHIPEMFKDGAVEREFNAMLEKRTQMILSEKAQRDKVQKRLDHLRLQNELESTPAEPTTVIIKVEETRRRVRARGPGK